MESSGGQFRESQVGRNRKRKKRRKKQERKERKRRGKMMEIKKVVGKWEIWEKKEEVARSETEAKKLVLEKFHK